MLYPHEYSFIEDSHCFKFNDLNLNVNLCPAHYTFPEINPDLNIYFVDITRSCEKRNRINFGKTASNILHEFICSNTSRAIGFYPIDNSISDSARVKLFADWEQHVDTSYVVKFQNSISIMDEEIVVVIYVHENYSKQTELITQLNDISKSISSK